MRIITAVALLGAIASDAFAQNPPPPPPGQPAAQGRGGGGRGGGGRGRGGIRVMTLTSSAFTDGGMIPNRHAQPGRDVSPPLAWSGAPDSTVSFVLIVHDADAAIGNGTDDLLHWMVWNISGTATSLPEGVPEGAQLPPAAGQQGGGMRQISGTGPYYRGPGAPATGPPHHYIFELFALDAMINVQPVGMTVPATRAAVVDAMATHIRGKAVLVGLFRRAAP